MFLVNESEAKGFGIDFTHGVMSLYIILVSLYIYIYEAQQAETVLSAVLSIYIYISWPSGLAVTICDNRAARR